MGLSRVRRDRDTIKLFWSKVLKTDACWFWIGATTSAGYGEIKYQGRTVSTHRLSFTLAKGEIPEGQFVCHTCDNKPCVNPAHLFLGTALDNGRDCASKGRSLPGDKNGQAKLSLAMVEAIRNTPKHTKGVAKKYGIGHSQIGRIRSNNSWRTM